jgi:glyoxylate reductase
LRPKILVRAGLDERRLGEIARWADVVGDLSQAEGVLASTALAFSRETFASAPRLRALSIIGVGYDHVDLAAAKSCGVVVAHTPGVLSDAVAELTIGMMIALARRFAENERALRSGSRPAPLGAGLSGKTLAVIGCGRIGREVIARGRSMKMRVLGVDGPTIAEQAGAEPASSLQHAMREADVVTVHVDLNPGTRHLIGAPELSLMKPSAFLINTSRGPVVDQQAVADALVNGRLAGAALDVLETEPADPNDPILSAPNVLLLPHIGSATVETRAAMLQLAIENLRACLLGEPCRCLVPLPSDDSG